MSFSAHRRYQGQSPGDNRGLPVRRKEGLLESLIIDPDFEWLVIDAGHCKVHPHAAGAEGGNEGMGCTKGGLNSRIHLAVDAHGMPVRVIVTEGTRADCKEACALIDGLSAGALLADRGYDTESLVRKAGESGCRVVIPPRKSLKILRNYDRELYKTRHLVENAFLRLKRWRGIAARYARQSASFLAAVQIRCISLWANII